MVTTTSQLLKMPDETRERSSSEPEENLGDSMKITGYIELCPEHNAPIHTYGQGYPERRASDGTVSPFIVNTSKHSAKLGIIEEENKGRVHLGVYLSKRVLTLLFLGIFIVVASLAIGLGLGLTTNLRKSPVAPRELFGAFNGSGIVALDLGDIAIPKITTYTQNVNGSIVESGFLNGNWSGGTDADEVMATNVRNGTPLMALSYANNDELTVSVFHVSFLMQPVSSFIDFKLLQDI